MKDDQSPRAGKCLADRLLPIMLALTLLLALLPVPVPAQGFAGLGQGGEGFELPLPNPEFTFPEDHGPHPRYRIEWWYLTASLQDADGTRYGIQWTLFRSALSPEGPQVWMGHFGLTTPDAHYSGEKLARGAIGQAGVTADPFSAWIDDWEMAGPAFDDLTLRAATGEAGYDLRLEAEGPLVFHGADGFSTKSASGVASYYYSQPFYEVSGTLALPEGEVAVTGRGWLDREWSSQPLEDDQEGWDWFSLHLEDGHKLMAFQLRGGSPYTYASWIAPDGTLTPHRDGALTLTPQEVTRVADRDVPTRWRLELPAEGVDIEVDAVNPDSWQPTLFPYWEGPVTATGTHTAEGYLEMTGYE
jgi:predicted secreted hydrolase